MTNGDKQSRYIHVGGALTGEDSAGEVLERMPVLLTPREWPSPDKLAAGSKSGMLAMLDDSSQTVAGTLSAHPVDR